MDSGFRINKKLVFFFLIGMLAFNIYYLTFLDNKIKQSTATEEVFENLYSLTLNFYGQREDLKDNFYKYKDSLDSLINRNPQLKKAIESDLAIFLNNVEHKIEGVPVERPNFQYDILEGNNKIITRIVSKIKGQKTNSSLNSNLQIFLFIELLFLLICFYLIFTHKNSFRKLLKTIRETRGIPYRKNNDIQKSWETEEEINQTISDLQFKLEDKNKKLKEKCNELKDKQELISLLIKNIPVGLAVSSLNKNELKIRNGEFSRLYSLKPKLLGSLDSALKSNINNNSSNQISELRNKSGRIRNGASKPFAVKRISLPQQNLLISIVKDNTELIEKEKALMATEKISELIFESVSIGLSLLDNNGCFLKVNQRFCMIYGYTREELIGKHFSILIPAEQKLYYKRRFANPDQLSSGEIEEYKVINKNGEVRNVLSSSESLNIEGCEGVIYSVIDITKTKIEEEKMMAAIDGARLGTWAVNFETHHNEVNDQWAEMLGYKKHEIIPDINFFENLIHPEDRASFKASVELLEKGQKDFFYQELRLKCKNGTYKWVLDSGKVIRRNAQGQPILMAGSHIDIENGKRKELELRQAGERLRRAQEMGMVGDWELELATGLYHCSSMVFRILGRKKVNSKLEGEEIIQQFNPNSASKFKTGMDRISKTKVSLSMEGDITLPDGKLKHLRIIAVPILGANSEVLKIMGIFQDITSLKETQQNLQITNRRLQALSDNIPGGLIQFEIKDYLPPKILYLSKGSEKIWNLSREKVLSGNGEQLLENISHQDRNFIKRSVLVASRKLHRLSIVWRTISNNEVVKWHHAIGIPIRNKDNSVTWNALLLDVTEKMVAEIKVKEQEQFMQVVAKHASDAIIVCDVSGNIQFLNQTFIDWVGKQDTALTPEKWPRAFNFYSLEEDRFLTTAEFGLFQAMKTAKITKQEFIIKNPAKSIRYVQSSGSALKDSSNNIVGAMLVIRDITQRVKREIKVSNAIIKAREKERGKIASEIHDGITQSLSVVAMNMKNLRYDYPEINSCENYLRSLTNLNQVIEQSRNMAHKIMPASIIDFGLIEAIKELVDQTMAGSEKQINFRYNNYRRMETRSELHIFRVIQEGLGNALKHSEASYIRINLIFEKNFVRGSLHDNGKGFEVNKNYLKHGIGLLSMKNRIQKIKGTFRIFSGKKGTVIWFKIPAMYNNS